MSTPATPVVEEKKPIAAATKPSEPPPTEHEITEAYLEKRAKGETENLPVPEPAIKHPDAVATEEPATDAYIAERQERKRKERGGKQAKIDELTKEKAELAAKVKAAEEAKAVEAAKPKEEPKPVEVPKQTEPPKSKPKMNEFTDIDEYHAAMALWAAEERARVNGSAPKAEEPKPDQAVQIAKIRKEEFDNFLEKGKRFVAGHPDFNEILEAAHVRGLTMSEAARTAITRLAVPEVAYWLAKPENDLAARRLMEMDPMEQVAQVGMIAERLKVSPSDFVSSAPQPGIRLTGASHVEEIPLQQLTDTDEYIRRRKMEKRSARGR